MHCPISLSASSGSCFGTQFHNRFEAACSQLTGTPDYARNVPEIEKLLQTAKGKRIEIPIALGAQRSVSVRDFKTHG